ncbi:MAG: Oligopeptidase A [Phycisphaerae bacterium]|nr:Oligopeptidase A [Phycisphaerae bacterium]
MNPSQRRTFGTTCLLLALGIAGCEQTGRQARMTDMSDPHWAIERIPLDRNAAQFTNFTREHLAYAQSLLSQTLAVSGPRTVANTLDPLNDMWMHVDLVASHSELYSQVHPDEAVRHAAEEGSKDVSKFVTGLWLNRDLFNAYAAVDVSAADEATKYMVAKALRDFRREGVDRDDATRAKVEQLNQEIVDLGLAFKRNISEDTRYLEVESPSDLAGVPKDLVDAWVKESEKNPGGRIRISTDYPQYVPFMKYAHSDPLRKDLMTLFMNRAYPANVEPLAKLIARRDEKAKLLGYANWADYATEVNMIGSGANALAYIDRVQGITRAAADREIGTLLEYKRRHDPATEGINAWDVSYYLNKAREDRYDVNPQDVRRYFDFPDVMEGLLTVTGRLFDVKYVKVEGLALWHPDVTAYDLVRDGERIGRFYLDLFPRENKYKHMAQFDYAQGVAGKRLPQAVLVCNFPKPDGKPGSALMEHGDVVTFFHEFGHLLHTLFAGRQTWVRNAGISTEWDFVEAPSQMLEEWAWRHETLKLFAKHYETREPIPADLVAKMQKARMFGEAYHWARQTWLAAISLGYYTADPATLDTTRKMIELTQKYSPVPYMEGTHFQCSFGHLDHYSAVYYTYVWSKGIACDLFSPFEQNGMFHAPTAKKYRDRVLAPGGSRKAGELVKDFLGRDFTLDAFERYLRQGA